MKNRLGIDYENLKLVNPRIILASISGFGQTGPYAKRPGFDQIAQGMGGLMSITGEPEGGPMRVGIPIADLTAEPISPSYANLLACSKLIFFLVMPLIQVLRLMSFQYLINHQ